MPLLVCVYDTNLYRALSPAAFEARLREERAAGIIACGTYAGLSEMVARLADAEKREAGAALASIRRLFEHTKQFDGRTTQVRFMAEPLDQISMSLFHTSIEDSGAANWYGELAGRLATEPEALAELSELVALVADEANVARTKFRDELWHNVVLPLAPEAVSWADILVPSQARTELLESVKAREGIPVIAAKIASEAARAVGIELSPEDQETARDRVLKRFGWIVEFRNLIIEKLVVDGASYDARARRNGVFDLHFCGASSPTARYKGSPVVVVTDDSEVLEAARRASLGKRVMRHSEYGAMLASGRDAIDDFARAL